MFFRIVIPLILSLSLLSCSINPTQIRQPINPIKVNNGKTSNKVVCIVIDSLMDKPMKNAIDSGQAPALKFFMDNGHYSPNLISSFPTMSVTIDSTFLTGTYADQHKIPGLFWYNHSKNRLISYGNAVLENIKLGIPNFIHDSLYNLNNEDLSSEIETIYEQLHSKGFESASINGLVYRGNTEHTLKLPKLLTTLTTIPKEIQTKGPTLLSFGQLKKIDVNNHAFINNYGISDKGSRIELSYLIQQNKLPSFTLVYFPGNDRPVHNKGPENPDGVIKADRELQSILNNFPSWQDALNGITWVIIGDSGQSAVVDDKDKALIDLRKILTTFDIAKLGEMTDSDEIVLAPNERMAYIYALQQHVKLPSITEKLLQDNRIAFISWKEQETAHVVAPHQNKEFTFKKEGKYTDDFHQSWDIQGDSTILDLTIKKDGAIQYGDYPDGLARLWGALSSHKGRFLIVDAKTGYEFKGESSPTHIGGGAHGSLHAEDSLAPIIIAGTNELPPYYRIIDLKNWILKLIYNNK
jgi:predicted AlkP superfamily pyrophosphatase or phosphodiesterase